MRRTRALAFAAVMAAACSREAAAPVQTSPAPAASPARRPDVLLIIADDLYTRISLYGGPIATPNLERLARRGRRFDRAHVQYPLCNPSRLSMMTGLRPEQTGVLDNTTPPPPEVVAGTTLQDHFRANGYRTVRLGKVYHSTFERSFRWDIAEDAPHAGDGGDDSSLEARVRPTAGPDEREPDGVTARRAVQILSEPRPQPLFLAVGFLRPHSPWMAPQPYFDRYPPGHPPLPEQRPGDLDDVPKIALKHSADARFERERWGDILSAYAACVTFMDAQLGVILDALDREDRWKHTVVVFVSDHGIQRGEHGLWRKSVMFEESTRVPLVVAGLGVAQPGASSTSPVELVDLYPTLAALAGLPAPPGVDGTSLVPALRDAARPVRTAAFTVLNRGGHLARSIRTDRHRLTLWRPGVNELYDLGQDPQELTNLARDPGSAAIVDRLGRAIEAGPAAAVVR